MLTLKAIRKNYGSTKKILIIEENYTKNLCSDRLQILKLLKFILKKKKYLFLLYNLSRVIFDDGNKEQQLTAMDAVTAATLNGRKQLHEI